MKTLIITGAGGLVGSAAVEYFHAKGYRIVGIDNDLRGKLLHDPSGSTMWNITRLQDTLKQFKNHLFDVRDKVALSSIFQEEKSNVLAIVHCAAQTAHEGELMEDFEINVLGTLNLLDLWRRFCPEAVFVYMSTIKLYGSFPNTLTYHRGAQRYDLEPGHRFYAGFDESVSIDQGMSSFFGRSKTAADLYVQEYSYQYNLPAACFRASCLTGGMHAGTEAHGMLSYMMRCAYKEIPYRIYGYEGLQVRDQLHADDLIEAVNQVIVEPRKNVVYNIGGGRANACSVLEAVEQCEQITGKRMNCSFHDMRTGDHRWWVTDNSRLTADFPNWRVNYSLKKVLEDIFQKGKDRW